MLKPLMLSLGLLLLSCMSAEDTAGLQIFLVGDSTMSIKETNKYPETGWGEPFAHFFEEGVRVENHAKNGRSTKTFLSEKRWQAVIEEVKAGDWVFIQFGHNDESKEKVERYTCPDEYRANLLRMVQETRQKGASPLLLTPVSRRQFDEQGKVKETHLEYSRLVRALAKEQGVPLIDLDRLSQGLYQKFGPESSRLLFLQLAPGEHPNYPAGISDNTHFSELGARQIAQLVLAEIKAQELPLADKIVKPAPKK